MPATPPASGNGEDTFAPLTAISFADVEAYAWKFAEHLEAHKTALHEILSRYETYEVFTDEMDRTLDLLRSLPENAEYFTLRIGAVTSFLPKNQPLYALTCFVLIPALMASEVHFRIPHAMRQFFPALLEVLQLTEFFPNVIVSVQERLPFLQERSALLVDPDSQESLPVSDAVIFTGTPQHAHQLRLVFPQSTLFISNGAGHNPLVVTPKADIAAAIEATLALCLYNQGQDCAAPNAILVHEAIYNAFMMELRKELSIVGVGPYHDRTNRVGPIRDVGDLVRIQELLARNHDWIDPATPGTIRTQTVIVEPTIIERPLVAGGNFRELFAPLIMVQQYDRDSDLDRYFEHAHYAQNAMYVTVYGESDYVEQLSGQPVNGVVLYDETTILRNTHLHAPGVERGTQPYGGYGPGASSLSLNGRLICKPTLPQRDIYEHVVQPLLTPDGRERRLRLWQTATERKTRDVSKLLRLKRELPGSQSTASKEFCYVDGEALPCARRYAHVPPQFLYQLLGKPNVEQIAGLRPVARDRIRALRSLLKEHPDLEADALTAWLYALPKSSGLSGRQVRKQQAALFVDLYQLLLGTDRGPRLAPFLLDVDRDHVCLLLDV
ncbi:aldehyde dehydrogenase family protein [Gimesia algae]|uniref:N-succinylglutamate 5-semialdehyde dehydrogenase n=1 Tax=Gimesia algae TaxID=2527971 RepID=A0A517VEM6_9PLAN|nr:aldehyde dehydrogenase family protein [Gimesia algae]QDT91464.1 N-succinylglutamate 5-semialdehyde dehydrogenase [Gimesia algae]